MVKEPRWIPPGALVFSQIAHGISWVLLFWIGMTASVATPSMLALAWVHVVALGWATMAALGILLHVIPTFTGTQWRNQYLPRYALVAFGAGISFFIAGLLWRQQILAFAAGLMLIALIAYAAGAFTTLRDALQKEVRERTIARALGSVLVFLLATALLGTALATLLSGYRVPSWVGLLPASHGNLGMLGWLSLLIFGVSTRTVHPITGNASRFRAAHIITGTCAVVGVVMLAIGLAANTPLTWIGAFLFGVAAIVYALDMFDVLRRSNVPHRVPQAFLAAGVVWFLVAMVLGAGSLLGKPWQLIYVFVLLAGWIGQMLDAHVYHIGVRLLLTIYRGEDDETRPGAVLDARLSWITFAAFQITIIGILAGGLMRIAPLVTIGALCGFIGWIMMMANLAIVRLRAKEIIIIPRRNKVT